MVCFIISAFKGLGTSKRQWFLLTAQEIFATPLLRAFVIFSRKYLILTSLFKFDFNTYYLTNLFKLFHNRRNIPSRTKSYKNKTHVTTCNIFITSTTSLCRQMSAPLNFTTSVGTIFSILLLVPTQQVVLYLFRLFMGT